jgi:hypothetical protein
VRLSLSLAAVALTACASLGRPPGGPERHDPPEIVSVSVDTNATNVKPGKITITFDEIIAEKPSVAGAGTAPQTLDGVVMISPMTGASEVNWHRGHIDIQPKGGFKPNTAYRVTLLPGISDIRGNVRKEGFSIVFTTGATLPKFSILGQAFDWQANTIAPSTTVEAIAHAGTKDSVVYIGVADSTGRFDVGPLDTGKYLVRGFIDADNNRAIGPLEKWDTTSVEVTDHRPVVELRVIQRDTAPPGIQQVAVMDSTWIRLTLDKPYDPTPTLQPALVALKRRDSSTVDVAGVMTEARAQSERPRADSARDTTARRPAAAGQPPITTPQPIAPVSTLPPAPKPSMPPPERVIIVHLAPGFALKPDSQYVITLRGIRNLIGHAGSASFEFTAPKPPPPPKPPVKPPVKPPPTNPSRP